MARAGDGGGDRPRGLWLAHIEELAQELDSHTGEMDQELLALDAGEAVRFSVDSGAAVTVITPQTASDYPVVGGEPRKRMRDCQGNSVEDKGAKVLALRPRGGRNLNFAKVTVAGVHKNLLAVKDLVEKGPEVVFRKRASYIRNLATGAVTPMEYTNGQYEVAYELQPFGSAPRPPPRRKAE